MLTPRQINILTDVIREYIRDVRPVGSLTLVGKPRLDVSPATVRNDMLELEQEGFLFQPYTSAGRIPTEKAWRYYLDHVVTEHPATKTEQTELRKIVKAYHSSQHEMLKHIAQSLADMTQQAVFVAFSPRDTYYTGISKLFDQPEFEEIDLVRSISHVVDHLEETIPAFIDQLDRELKVLLGHESTFNRDCSVILTSLRDRHSLLGMLGPIRQDYDRHLGLVRFTHSLLTA